MHESERKGEKEGEMSHVVTTNVITLINCSFANDLVFNLTESKQQFQ